MIINFNILIYLIIKKSKPLTLLKIRQFSVERLADT